MLAVLLVQVPRGTVRDVGGGTIWLMGDVLMLVLVSSILILILVTIHACLVFRLVYCAMAQPHAKLVYQASS